MTVSNDRCNRTMKRAFGVISVTGAVFSGAVDRSASAAPVTFTFEDLRSDNALIHTVGLTYTADGFTIASLPRDSGVLRSLVFLHYPGDPLNELRWVHVALQRCRALQD